MVEIFDATKAIIRGLLLAQPGDMSVWAVRRAYRAHTGVALPFVRFGYPTATTFLASMPEVCIVVVSYDRCGVSETS